MSRRKTLDEWIAYTANQKEASISSAMVSSQLSPRSVSGSVYLSAGKAARRWEALRTGKAKLPRAGEIFEEVDIEAGAGFGGAK